MIRYAIFRGIYVKIFTFLVLYGLVFWIHTQAKEHFNSSVRLKGALKNAWLFEHRRIKYSLEAT